MHGNRAAAISAVGQPVAFQRDDLDGDGKIDELVFLAAFETG